MRTFVECESYVMQLVMIVMEHFGGNYIHPDPGFLDINSHIEGGPHFREESQKHYFWTTMFDSCR